MGYFPDIYKQILTQWTQQTNVSSNYIVSYILYEATQIEFYQPWIT